MESIQGKYGVHQRLDGKTGSVFWFEFPYRADEGAAAMAVTIMNILSSSHSTSVGCIADHSNTAPCATSNTVEVVPLNIMSSPLSSSASIRKLNILIVDDSLTIVKMITMMLRQKGHQVTSVENGALAFEKLQQEWMEEKRGYDIVLMDLQMPVMDGLEATRRWRKLEVDRTSSSSKKSSSSVAARSQSTRQIDVEMKREDELTPTRAALVSKGPNASNSSCLHHQIIIGMSANSDDDTVEDAFTAGVDDFIKKPFTMEIFMTAVRKVLSPSLPLH